jgi:hypothetical protein
VPGRAGDSSHSETGSKWHPGNSLVAHRFTDVLASVGLRTARKLRKPASDGRETRDTDIGWTQAEDPRWRRHCLPIRIPQPCRILEAARPGNDVPFARCLICGSVMFYRRTFGNIMLYLAAGVLYRRTANKGVGA